jgi:hypothetical protein
MENRNRESNNTEENNTRALVKRETRTPASYSFIAPPL